MKMATLYDRVGETARDWAGQIREEIVDLPKSDVVTEAGERAATWVGGTAEKLAAKLPGTVAARRTRRRRLIWAGLAAALLLYLFGPGGADRRAAWRSRFEPGPSPTD